MKVAIMQPYFFPYIGYYQLIQAVDVIVIYDNIKYTKKGWINRNRYLLNGRDQLFSLPLKRNSDFLDIREREIAESFERDKLLQRIKGAYRKAPFFQETFGLIEETIGCEKINLFDFLHNSLLKTCSFLGITTEVVISSTVNIDHNLQSQDKVLALCKELGAATYFNPVGGQELYSRKAFQEQDLELYFLKPELFSYRQFDDPFVPWLSIIDVLMFNCLNDVQGYLKSRFELL
ncbi:WbqC family protein [Kiloniella laminariae]|uniref:WbqC family protein n=1 Tax=Kiloniella laminariae TaxID=454162 RepID=A0ABT4LHC5_9PROT|nr:WbqC family protein [Kiloniella laminariae]MCZ4280508.1 WbqC family protein [Kiloniella laminariae]